MARRNLLPASGSPAAQLLRTAGLVFIFVLAGLLFWKYYERSLDRIIAGQQIVDETDALAAEQKEQIAQFAETLKQDYGLRFQLQVHQGRIRPPKLDSRTLYIGLSPKHGEWRIVFPVLLKQALPEDFVRYLQEEHFHGPLSDNTWPEALMNGLHAIFGHLSRIQSGDQAS